MIDDVDESLYKLKSEYKQMEKNSKQKNEQAWKENLKVQPLDQSSYVDRKKSDILTMESLVQGQRKIKYKQ